MTTNQPRRRIAAFLDCPNILAADLGIAIEDIDRALSLYGDPVVKRAYSNRNATARALEAVTNNGY